MGLAPRDGYIETGGLNLSVPGNLAPKPWEMIKCDCYAELISLVAQFTSFESCASATNSVYYLLQLWSRLVTSVAYLKGEGESHLDSYVPQ
ncbi:hypothetical protein T484DRAFT_1793071, partial [Baffinella frigidus]